MFYKINDKYYVKLRTYYKEVEVKDGNVTPSKAENSRIEDMKIIAIPVTLEELLKENEETPKEKKMFSKRSKKIEE